MMRGYVTKPVKGRDAVTKRPPAGTSKRDTDPLPRRRAPLVRSSRKKAEDTR